MKTLLRIILGLIVIGLVALVAIIFVPPSATPPNENLAADWAPAPGQGEYVTRLTDCAACHTAPDGKPFAGGRAIDSPLGTIWSTNITADPKTGIGNWTLDQFRASLVDGVAPGGKHLYPAMPYENYRKLSEQDIRSIFSYLKNDVEPVEYKAETTNLAFPFNQRWGIRVWNWAALSKAGFKPTDKVAGDDVLTRGAYLVQGLGHCAACHSPRNTIMAQAGTNGSDAAFLSGGELDGWSVPDLRTAHAALQNWSDADLKDYLLTGRNSHSAVVGEMSLVVKDSLQYMTDEDADAMVAYLRSISDVTPTPLLAAPDDQLVADRVAAADDATSTKLKAAVDLSLGERVYMDNCSACHMIDGKGASGVFPSLVGNSLVVADKTKGLTHVILNGAEMPSTSERPSRLRMPAFDKRLSNEELAALESFVRSGWGNSASSVTEDNLLSDEK